MFFSIIFFIGWEPNFQCKSNITRYNDTIHINECVDPDYENKTTCGGGYRFLSNGYTTISMEVTGDHIKIFIFLSRFGKYT